MTALPKAPLQRTPLYRQIADHLADRILCGKFVEGCPLPNEYALSCEFGVSIGTVRSAIQTLVDENLVVRQQGRGTFVTDNRWLGTRQKAVHIRFGESAEFGRWLYRELDYAKIEASPRVAADLELRPGEPVHYFRRLRFTENKSDTILETGFVPIQIFPILNWSEHGRRDALSNAKNDNILIGPVERKVNACCPTEEEAHLLEVELNTPLLRIRRRICDRDGRPIETRTMLYAAGEGYFWSYDE